MQVSSLNDGYEGLVIQDNDGFNLLSIIVNGVHCALCIQKIEGKLRAIKNVTEARLNFSTGRLNIKWKGHRDDANSYVHDIESLGYKVIPYSPDLEKITSDEENRFLLLCLGVAGFAMGNIMLLSVGLWTTDTATMGEGTRALLHWISALIAIPAIIFSGRPFFRSALDALKQGRTNMDVPISLALILASVMSLFETINHGEHAYFDSAVMLMFFLLIGRYLDFRARRNARSAATELMQSLTGFATVLDHNRQSRILVRDLKEGMLILVAAGEKIPADGIVILGESTIDTSLITGETLPRDIGSGAEVYAGTINQSAPLTIKVSHAAESTLLADIIRLIEKAEQNQAKYVQLADRIAKLYTPFVHTLAALAFIVWFFLWDAFWQESLMVSVTVLIITCPCALALAVPVVQVLATSILMKKGILVKSGDALERLSSIDTILFDKTGTLTLGQPALIGTYDPEHLKLAASLAIHSKHPLSKAIVEHHNHEIFTLTNIREIPGNGMEGYWDGKHVRLGKRIWIDAQIEHHTDKIELWIQVENQEPICFEFLDQLKCDATEALKMLKDKGFSIAIISGDRQTIVKDIASKLGIDSVYAEQTPSQKHAILEKYKASGHHILMVGDGLNDAPALAGADVSMAPGSAVDLAQNSADIVFMGNNLSSVYTAIQTARFTQKLVVQNFGLAFAYNLIAVPLAFAGLITPLLAAIAMSSSSLIVIANSFRLKLLR